MTTRYARIEPARHLSSLVESIWVQESEAADPLTAVPPTRVLPTGFVIVAFYYREPFYKLLDGVRTTLGTTVVTGPHTKFREYGATGRTGILLVRLRPGAAGRWLGCSLAELRDSDVGLDQIFPVPVVREVEERLSAAPDTHARVSIVQRFIGRQLAPDRDGDDLVRAALQSVLATSGSARVHDLARLLGRSQRQLQRKFHQFVGLGPKSFSRIVRFQTALDRYRDGYPWSSIAYACGYQDQAHLVNECRALAGFSPGNLSTRWDSTALATFFNARPGVSRFCKTVYI